ncbi:MAG: hypothetical protein M3O31_00165 [Acidobacteriota bacterium]|nr:hypothetical protein [Acidobacteriota bacterium]
MFLHRFLGHAGTVSTLLFVGLASCPQSHAQTNSIQSSRAAPAPGPASARRPSNGNESQVKKDETRLLRILARDPDNVGALAGMAWVRSRQKNYLAAISYLERAKRKSPGDLALSRALDLDRFRVIIAEADHALSSNELTSAAKLYALAIQIRPSSRDASMGLQSAVIRQQQSRDLAVNAMR